MRGVIGVQHSPVRDQPRREASLPSRLRRCATALARAGATSVLRSGSSWVDLAAQLTAAGNEFAGEAGNETRKAGSWFEVGDRRDLAPVICQVMEPGCRGRLRRACGALL